MDAKPLPSSPSASKPSVKPWPRQAGSKPNASSASSSPAPRHKQTPNQAKPDESRVLCTTVKAFNSLSPEFICAEARQFGGRRVVFFSGDHIRAKREAARLIGCLGFAGIDLGGLAEGGRLQQFPDGPLRGLNLITFDVQDVSVEM